MLCARRERSRAAELLIAENPLVARTVAPQFFDLADRANPAAGAGRRAVQPRGGATKFKYLWKCIAAEQGVGEAGMKDVARSGGVHSAHAKGGAVVELRSVPSEDAIAPERGPGHAASETPRDLRQRLQ